MSAAASVEATVSSPESLPEWPLFGFADDMRPAMARAVAQGARFALATLIAAEGGAPRPLGAQMLVGPAASPGLLSGFLSGGCVEGDVVAHARAALTDGRARRLIYGEGSPWPDIRLLCGARIEVLVEPVAADAPAVADLLAAEAERRPVVWITDGGAQRVERAEPDAPALAVDAAPFRVARRFDPTARMLVIGGDPTALAIAGLAAQSGFDTWLLRPKGPERPPPLPGVRYDRRAPAEVFAELDLDPWTAVAVATHDLETDEAALLAALPSSAGYVGVLGARRRLPERRARLAAAGVGQVVLARLRGPIGLDLGGKSPFEIAVAVVAEVIAARGR